MVRRLKSAYPKLKLRVGRLGRVWGLGFGVGLVGLGFRLGLGSRVRLGFKVGLGFRVAKSQTPKS